ncbi:abortive infection family protein (plasmid) [Burkholderia plantarii]|uniref:abortive infection family protein n=1 Tax=Burkholderia plantarii TaxID=41899 RepID=UPI00272A6D98|nr:abortive infection family protein [Burkholderia plantarii]WLE64100.1 abortive infection family protein [Burkholderia plantarii]
MSYTLRALADQRQRLSEKSGAVRERCKKLSEELSAAVGLLPMCAWSEAVTVVKGDADSYVRARLFYADGKLSVLSRTSRDDQVDDEEGIREADRSWDNYSLAKCPSAWLELLLVDQVLDSLLVDIKAGLDSLEAKLDGSLSATSRALASEAADIDLEMGANAAVAGDTDLPRLWREAVDATHRDSADALTRCSRFLEAVCSKILRERGVALPKDKSMQPLVKSCLDAFNWPDERQAEADVRQLLGSIQGVCGAIGTLRTHYGTAHGASAHLPPLDPGYAVFVKQATMAAATFLLDRHAASPTLSARKERTENAGDPGLARSA